MWRETIGSGGIASEHVATWPVILILAAVQGVAEFLPISSSGHLVILSDLMSQDVAQFEISDINIVLHVGTLVSILVYYWRRIWSLLTEDRRLIGVLLLATMPAVLVGLPIKLWAEGVLESGLVAGLLLPVTGLVLLLAARFRTATGAYQTLGWGRAVLIGCSQAAAILPGLSRSGLTIAAGMSLGLAPGSAATFSFLLAIPAIGGAGLLEAITVYRHGGLTTPWPMLAAGLLLSFAVGLVSLWLLEHLLQRGRAQYFAYWVIPVGLIYSTGKLTQLW